MGLKEVSVFGKLGCGWGLQQVLATHRSADNTDSRVVKKCLDPLPQPRRLLLAAPQAKDWGYPATIL